MKNDKQIELLLDSIMVEIIENKIAVLQQWWEECMLKGASESEDVVKIYD